MKEIVLSAALILSSITSSSAMASGFQRFGEERVEQISVERRMADMESVAVRKALDGLVRGDYVEKLFVEARSSAGSVASSIDIIVDQRILQTVRLDQVKQRYVFPIQMRNGDDYTRILIRARGSVYLAKFGVVIDDESGGWQPTPEPPRYPSPPPQNPFTQGEFCNGTNVIHWECGQGAYGAVRQADGCYHTDTGRSCGVVRPPSNPFTQGEFCNGTNVIHWECGQGAYGAVRQADGCYHTDTGRRCY